MRRAFAIASPGLEAVVADEVRALPGARQVTVVDGGVDFVADDATLTAARGLRVATRVLVRAGQVKARDFARFRSGAAALPWRELLAAPWCAAHGTRGTPRLAVHATVRKSRLYHTGALAERLAGAVADALGRPAPPEAPEVGVWLRGEDDVFTVSLDASGGLLHRRGWRVDTAPASLRETLAAGILRLAGWSASEPLVDPMCGAGTIVLEAGDSAPPPTPAPLLLGADRDPATLELARRNAARAGLAERVRLVCADARQLELPASPPGLIVCNPPYGRRLQPGAERESFGALGAFVRRHPGWRLAVLAPHPLEALRAIRPDAPRARHPLDNGGLRVWLSVWPALPPPAR